MFFKADDHKKLARLCEQITAFSSQQISGANIGNTSSYQQSLLSLRMAAGKLLRAETKTDAAAQLNALEGSLQATVTMSASSMLGSDTVGYVSPKEIESTLVFFDHLREKYSLN